MAAAVAEQLPTGDCRRCCPPYPLSVRVEHFGIEASSGTPEAVMVVRLRQEVGHQPPTSLSSPLNPAHESLITVMAAVAASQSTKPN